jgi:hypothetical protein
MTIIKIGHSAYKGTNALRFCFSKAQAVRVLCNRGMKRAEARLAIEKITSQKTYANQLHLCVDINFEICEIANMTQVFTDPALRDQHGYYGSTPQIMRSAWKNAPEL